MKKYPGTTKYTLVPLKRWKQKYRFSKKLFSCVTRPERRGVSLRNVKINILMKTKLVVHLSFSLQPNLERGPLKGHESFIFPFLSELCESHRQPN